MYEQYLTGVRVREQDVVSYDKRAESLLDADVRFQLMTTSTEDLHKHLKVGRTLNRLNASSKALRNCCKASLSLFLRTYRAMVPCLVLFSANSTIAFRDLHTTDCVKFS
jgi:hypothetical protein